ncbi:hypothetical protein [Nocardiopsis salina]|uniref:hypothetical protein n=1 Tax=Nocardiopsis salina TaxID=245836 RepID=UPI000344B121|nr:hypothetical protein [Nocardiopsis salina]
MARGPVPARPRRRWYGGQGGGYGWGRRRHYHHDPYYHGGHPHPPRRNPIGAVIGWVAALFIGMVALVIMFFALLF